MSINYAIPTKWEFDYFYNGSSIVLAAPNSFSLTSHNFKPRGLHNFERKGEAVSIPEGHGAHFLSDGFANAVEMEFSGDAFGIDPHDTFDFQSRRFGRFVNVLDHKYIRAGLHDGAQKVYYRRYGQPINGNSSFYRRTEFIAVQNNMTFLATDPGWYADAVSADSFNVNSGTSGSKIITDGGDFNSKRCVIFITRTGATPADVTIKNAQNHTLAISGTLAANNDYYEIDMLQGIVKKSASGVVTNNIAAVTGRFFEIAKGTDTITFTSSVSCSVSVSIFWLPRFT